MKIVVFAYNFPHKKTQDFLIKLLLEGYDIALVLAADPIELNYSKPLFRLNPRYMNLVHPLEICNKFNIPYHVIQHNSSLAIQLIEEANIDIGLIAGARIIKANIISSVNKGIINFHPGKIPQIRGLDALKWSIVLGIPPAVSVHWIDENIDAGRLILTKEIPLYKDDTLMDLSIRLDEMQVSLIPKALQNITEKGVGEYPLIKGGCVRSIMPQSIESSLPERFTSYLHTIFNE